MFSNKMNSIINQSGSPFQYHEFSLPYAISTQVILYESETYKITKKNIYLP